MDNDFITIPEKDLRGPETESDQYAEEVRHAVEGSSHSAKRDDDTERDDAG